MLPIMRAECGRFVLRMTNYILLPMKNNRFSTKITYPILVAVFFSASLFCSRRLVYTYLSGDATQNYFTPAGPRDYLFFLVSVLIVACVTAFLYGQVDLLCKRTMDVTFFSENQERMIAKNKHEVLCYSLIMFAIWSLYYLTFYPGGMHIDAMSSYKMNTDGNLSNAHPILYTLLMRIFIAIGDVLGKDMVWQVGLFTAFQMVVMGCVFLYVLCWMIKIKLPCLLRCITMLYFIFFPLIPLNGISIWKDTLFAVCCLYWLVSIIEFYFEIRYERAWSKKRLLHFFLGAFLVSFLRPNGFYACLFVCVIFFLYTIKKKIKDKLKVYGAVIGFLLLTLFIQGPLYGSMGLTDKAFALKAGIPIQQLCAVMEKNASITDAQWKVLSKIWPRGDATICFAPCNSDKVKWDSSIDNDYLTNNTGEVMKVSGELLVAHPKVFLEETLLQTAGFWSLKVSGPDGYVQTKHFTDFGKRLYQVDYIEKGLGLSLKEILQPKIYLSSALFFWIFVFGAGYTLSRFGLGSMCLYALPFGLWLTVMLSTPLAVSMRYALGLVFMLPFVWLIPCTMGINDSLKKLNVKESKDVLYDGGCSRKERF